MTEIFLDTANLEEIQEILGWKIITGVTTNQKIFSKEKGCNFEEQSKAILKMVHPLPVSLEGPNNLQELLIIAKKYHSWGNNVIIKVPMLGNGDGIKAVVELERDRIRTNVTACMTLNQTFLAASAGATYVSLFYNRMKDMMKESCGLKKEEESDKATQYALGTIANTMDMIKDNNFKTKLIVGSIRKPEDIMEIVSAKPSIVTIPTKILKQMPYNYMTEKSLKEFEEAWEEFLKAEKKH